MPLKFTAKLDQVNSTIFRQLAYLKKNQAARIAIDLTSTPIAQWARESYEEVYDPIDYTLVTDERQVEVFIWLHILDKDTLKHTQLVLLSDKWDIFIPLVLKKNF